MSEAKVTKGYKVFNHDWTCRGFQYKVGETYHHDGKIELLGPGFHFCRIAANCFDYYAFNPRNKVAEVEAIGEVIEGGDKSVTGCIRIVREIPWDELLSIVNTGEGNTGYMNSGSWNTGHGNSGNWNTGNVNSGNWNSGHGNSGNRNSGNRNSGNRNSGNRNRGYWNTGNENSGNRNSGNRNRGYWNTGNVNSGNWNSGDWNTGDWNTGDWNSGSFNSGNWNSGSWNAGFFNTDEPFARCFNKSTNIYASVYFDLPGMIALRDNFKGIRFIESSDMTDDEKAEHPEHETTGGYLKEIPYKDACMEMWERMTEREKDDVKKLPNFDADIFYEITGISV